MCDSLIVSTPDITHSYCTSSLDKRNFHISTYNVCISSIQKYYQNVIEIGLIFPVNKSIK